MQIKGDGLDRIEPCEPVAIDRLSKVRREVGRGRIASVARDGAPRICIEDRRQSSFSQGPGASTMIARKTCVIFHPPPKGKLPPDH
jgi:hypothetical protein